MNWRQGKLHNLRFLLTLANWNPPELTSPLITAERVARLEEDARCDPGGDSPRSATGAQPSGQEGRSPAIEDQGSPQWLVDSTPLEESGTEMQASDTGVPEAEKREQSGLALLHSVPTAPSTCPNI